MSKWDAQYYRGWKIILKETQFDHYFNATKGTGKGNDKLSANTITELKSQIDTLWDFEIR